MEKSLGKHIKTVIPRLVSLGESSTDNENAVETPDDNVPQHNRSKKVIFCVFFVIVQLFPPYVRHR